MRFIPCGVATAAVGNTILEADKPGEMILAAILIIRSPLETDADITYALVVIVITPDSGKRPELISELSAATTVVPLLASLSNVLKIAFIRVSSGLSGTSTVSERS